MSETTRSHSFLRLNNISLHIYATISLSIHQLIVCFHALAIVNNAAVNIVVILLLCIYLSIIMLHMLNIYTFHLKITEKKILKKLKKKEKPGTPCLLFGLAIESWVTQRDLHKNFQVLKIWFSLFYLCTNWHVQEYKEWK